MLAKIKQYFAVAVVAVSSIFATSALAAVDNSNPQSVTQAAIDQTIQILDKYKGNLNTQNQALRSDINKSVLPYFQDRYIALSILGNYRAKASDAQLKNFQTAINNYMVNAYIEGLSFYNGQKVTVNPANIKSDKLAEVPITVPYNGKTLNILFKLFNYKGSWKIIDFVAEGISIVQTKSVEWQPILQKQGVEGLTTYINNNNQNILKALNK